MLAESDGEPESNAKNGTQTIFEPDNTIFKNYHFIPQYLDNLFWNYAYLNAGLSINFNGQKYFSQKGLFDLLSKKTNEEENRYPIIHLKGNDIEIAMTHGNQYGEEYYSFVNGQNTTQGGTHLQAFREAVVRTVRDFYKKDYAPEDIRASIVAAVAVRVQEPVFESQTKTKLGSITMSPDSSSQTVRSFVGDFIKTELDNFLHKNPTTAEALKNVLNNLSVSVKILQVSKNWRTSVLKKPICTTKNFVIVVCIYLTKSLIIVTIQCFSLPKVTRQVAQLPNQETFKRKLYLA
jgi:topoisomerase-4 subunit B